MSAVTAVPIRPLAKGALVKLWLALLVLVAAGAALAWFGTRALQRETTQSGLQYQVKEAGEGAQIGPQDIVTFHIVGRRADGTPFFSSLNGEPLTGTTSQGPIPGIGEALAMMRQGAHYRIWMPARTAFPTPPPAQARIAPDDTVSFDVQVVRVASLAEMMRSMGGGMGMPGMAPPEAGGAPGEDPHAGLPPEMGAPSGPEAPAGNAQ